MSTVTIESIEEIAPGLTFKAVLTRDDFDAETKEGRNGQSHYAIILTCNGRTFQTEYHQGSANRVYTDLTGRVTKKRVAIPYGRMTIEQARTLNRSVPIMPTLQDVLYCLVLDAQGTDCRTFEDWCKDYGYDSDSRSAEKAFNACRDLYSSLRAMGLDLERLSKLFQDY